MTRENTNDISVDKTTHVDVLPASHAGASDALDEAIDQVTKIATRLQATSNRPERITRLHDDLDRSSCGNRGRNRC